MEIPEIPTEEWCLQQINENNLRGVFENVFQRTPEEYLKEYSYLAPDIYISVLTDLQLLP